MTQPPDLAELAAAAKERYERAYRMVSALCSGKERWTMRVPAEPERDSDFVIGAALDDIPVLLDRILALIEERDRLRKLLRVEWFQQRSNSRAECPWCGGYRPEGDPSIHERGDGHRKDCVRAALGGES